MAHRSTAEAILWRPAVPGLEEAREAHEITLTAHVVLWNPCDGLHHLDTFSVPAIEQAIRDAEDGVYTHFAIIKGPLRS